MVVENRTSTYLHVKVQAGRVHGWRGEEDVPGELRGEAPCALDGQIERRDTPEAPRSAVSGQRGNPAGLGRQTEDALQALTQTARQGDKGVSRLTRDVGSRAASPALISVCEDL